MVTELRVVQLVCNHTRTPATRSSDFVNHSYDYRLNWTLISPANITYLHIIYLLFLIFANKKQLVVLLALIFALHRASSDSLATDLVAYTPAAPRPPIAASVPSSSSLVHVFPHPIPSSKCLFPYWTLHSFLKIALRIWFDLSKQSSFTTSHDQSVTLPLSTSL